LPAVFFGPVGFSSVIAFTPSIEMPTIEDI